MSHAAMAAIMAATGAADCKWHVFTWLSEHAAEFLLPIAMEAGDNTACKTFALFAAWMHPAKCSCQAETSV